MTVSVFKKCYLFVCHKHLPLMKRAIDLYGPTNMGSENIKPQKVCFLRIGKQRKSSTFDDEWNYVGILT
jgi:hypothetical protein